MQEARLLFLEMRHGGVACSEGNLASPVKGLDGTISRRMDLGTEKR